MDQVFYSSFKSPIGNIKAASTEKGVCYVELAQMSDDQFERRFKCRFNLAPVKDDEFCREVTNAFKDYFNQTLTEFDFALDLITGTSFQKEVWTRLQTIPFGIVKSYKWIASQIGKPNACRAVGNANGKNPIPIIIPCHRVICSDGALGGFTSGIEVKKKLLKLEGISEYS